jgi:hypothetical protein
MKRILLFTITIFTLAACKQSKDYLSRADEDRTLFDIVKRLNKRSGDEDASKALPEVYARVQQLNLKKIDAYKNNRDITRWEKIINGYSNLQHMYEAIVNAAAASRLVTPVNYQQELYDAKQNAAADYYATATTLLNSNDREDARKAYNYFKKADKWMSGYKDAKSKMDEAWQNAIINVVINPVQDNSFFFNTGWGNAGYNYSNQYFQQNLTRELGGQYATRYPARFFTDWEARRDNVQPDWVVDLILRDIDIPRPTISNSSQNVSKQVEAGRDSSGRIIYQTVTAVLHTKTESFTARAQMDVNITALYNRRNIAYNTYSEDYRWQQEEVTYTGNSAALSDHHWRQIRNSRTTQPTKDQVLAELYRQLYPQVKNRISYAVDW